MTVPTVAVTCRASVQNGPSIAGATFTAKLNQTELYNGLVAPAEVSGVTDVNGVLVLQLFPNVLGSAGSLYKITGTDPSGRKFLRANASVPNAACDLMNILTDLPPPVADVSTQAAASALASRNAAALSEASAANSAAASEVSATNSLTRSQNAATSQVAAAASANSALVSLNEFKGRSYGPLAADPTLDPLGAAPTVGDEYFNTVALATKRYNGTVWVADISRTDLAASGGAGLSGFDGSLNYATGTIGAHFGGQINIKDAPWLCKCDSNGTAGNGTDDTAGFWAAVAFAKAKGYKVIHPGGICRITSGYTQSVAFDNIFLEGNGRINRPDSASVGSTILFDSAGAASYFLNIAATTTMNCTGLIFRCAQAVVDRPFIKFSAALHAEFFANCHFLNVERPIVFAAGSYFQNSSYRDIMFYNSGTFHSESPDTLGALVGTLLTLDNVNHDGPVGAVGIISEKVVCNLQGIRQIWATTFLLEGSLPEAGWTILKINDTSGARYTRNPFIEAYNYWSEWTGFSPLYAVDQIGGTASFSGPLKLTLTNKYKLSALGRVNLIKSNFSITGDEASQFFEVEDGQCVVHFDGCLMRNFDVTKVGFLYTNTQYADAANGFGQLVLSNTVAEPIYRWTGGNIPADGCTLSLFSGTAVTSTDASFGRKIVFSPAAGLLNAQIRIPTVVGNLVKGEQIVVRAKAKLPTFATGLWRFDILIDNVSLLIKYFDATRSGQIVDVVIPWVLTANATINVGIAFGNGTTSGVATDVEVYALSVHHGHGISRSLIALYPTNINTHGTAAPTTGTWSRGDRVSNSAPAVAAVKAWACTASGTPGTWVSEGVL